MVPQPSDLPKPWSHKHQKKELSTVDAMSQNNCTPHSLQWRPNVLFANLHVEMEIYTE